MADRVKCHLATVSVCLDDSVSRADETTELVEQQLSSRNKEAITQRSVPTTRWLHQTQAGDYSENMETSDEKKILRRVNYLSRRTLSVSLTLPDVNTSKDKGAGRAASHGSHLTDVAENIKPSRALLLENWRTTTLAGHYQHSSPDYDTNQAVIRGPINLPCLIHKRIFTIYVCGGYQGTARRTGSLFVCFIMKYTKSIIVTSIATHI